MSDLPPDARDPRDQELRALLHDAVSPVTPADRLGEIRRRTRQRAPARRWAPLLVGAGAVAATVVAAGIVVGTLSDDPPTDPPVAGSSTPTTTAPSTAAAGIYFVSDTPGGPRLYREFQTVGGASDPAEKVLLSLQRLTTDAGPHDPDYDTLWPPRSFAAVQVEDDRVVVDLGSPDALLAGRGGAARGVYGVQQAVYTAEAALSGAVPDATLPLAFEYDDAPARTVLGVEVGRLVPRDRGYDITAPVNISDPGEHLPVDGVLSANGTLATNVAFVDWRLERDGTTVLKGRAQPVDITGADARATLGAPGWRTGDIDVSALPPGDYVFVVSTEVEGQTSDAPPIQFSDTRSITIP